MADYIVSEEVLREVLVCLNDHGTSYLGHEDEYATAVTTLAAILASPPAEPVARNSFQQEEYLMAQRTAYNKSNEGNG